MKARATIDRTRTDEERIEHLAEADGNGARAVELAVTIRPWLAGSVESAVQVQRLDGRSPADAMARGGPATASEEPPVKQSRRDAE